MSGDDFNPNECLIRFLPGATKQLLARSTLKEIGTKQFSMVVKDQATFNQSAALLMEVNKWIQPGTRFNCRIRVRFTNCIDCFSPDLAADDLC